MSIDHTWPASVSQEADAGSFKEKSERNVAEFKPTYGPPLLRRATSISNTTISFSALMSKTAFNAMKLWYEDDLEDGVLPFYRYHPYDVVNGALPPASPDLRIICLFVDAPEFSDAGSVYGRVSISLRVI